MVSADCQQVRGNLRRAYDGAADRRDHSDKQPWKLAELDKGLDARVMDFSQLDFPAESFDIVDFHIAEEGTERRFQSLTLRLGLG